MSQISHAKASTWFRAMATIYDALERDALRTPAIHAASARWISGLRRTRGHEIDPTVGIARFLPDEMVTVWHGPVAGDEGAVDLMIRRVAAPYPG